MVRSPSPGMIGAGVLGMSLAMAASDAMTPTSRFFAPPDPYEPDPHRARHLPLKKHVPPEGPCSFRATGNKRTRRRNRRHAAGGPR